MGTKQLQADKRVSEITLNEAGKAATLTLADGWTYEGSSGPFTLKNVEHGHQIVRGATNPNKATAKRAPPTERQNVTRGVNPEAADAPPMICPAKPRGDEVFVYRVTLEPLPGSKDQREICGWLRASSTLPPADLEARTWAMLRSHLSIGGQKTAGADTHVAKSWRWTNKDQAKARADGDMGSPWSGENHGD